MTSSNDAKSILDQIKSNLPLIVLVASIVTTWAYIQFNQAETQNDIVDLQAQVTALELDAKRISQETAEFRSTIASDIASIKTSLLFIQDALKN